MAHCWQVIRFSDCKHARAAVKTKQSIRNGTCVCQCCVHVATDTLSVEAVRLQVPCLMR